MTYNEKRKAKKLQLQKDNQYLLKQIFKLQANRTEILARLNAYKAKYSATGKCESIHIKRLVKYLGVNQRTIHLLMGKEFLHPYISTEFPMMDFHEVLKLIKSLPK